MKRFALALLVVLAGCASEPDLDLPRADLKEAPPDLAVLASTSRAAPRNLAVDLPSALSVGGARSIDVRVAQEKVEEARQAMYGALFSFMPYAIPGIVLRAHRDLLQNTNGDFSEVTKQSSFGGGTAAIQWQFGKAIWKTLAESRRTDAALAASQTARAEATLQIARAYYALVRARAIYQVAQQAVEESEEIAKEQQTRERLGAGIPEAVLRAKAELALREVERARAQAEIESASARLVAILELEPGVELVPLEPAPLPIVLVSPEAALDPLIARALASRPELAESTALIAAREKEHEGLEFGPLFPEIDAGVTSGAFGARFTRDVDESNDYAFGVGWRIGPGGLFDLPAINSAAARLRQQKVRDEGLRVEIARQVVEARARAAAAEREIAAARAGVASAQEALRLSRASLAKGAGTFLDVLDAQRGFTRARTDEIDAVIRQNRAQFELLRAIGEPIDLGRAR
jgi:outer membrane protein TolC